MYERLLLTILLCTVTAVAGAVNDLATIRARGTLIVSVKNQGAERHDAHKDPAHFEKRGMELELARAVAARVLGSPDKLDLRMMRKRERLPAVADGTVDLAISMVRITAVDDAVEFSHPYYASGIAVLQRDGGQVARAADLAGRTVAVVDRHDIDPALLVQELVPAPATAPRLVKVADFAAGAAAVERGEADCLLSEAVNIDVFLAAHGAAGWRRSPLLREDRFGVAVARGNRELLETVNAVIDELGRSGELAAMAKRAGLPVGDPQ